VDKADKLLKKEVDYEGVGYVIRRWMEGGGGESLENVCVIYFFFFKKSLG
jgi:hypothetical protein